MIVVGVDPGLAACGIAVLWRENPAGSWHAWSAETARTTPKAPLHERLRRIWKALKAGTDYAAEPLIVAIEAQSGASEGARRAGVTNADALLVQQVVGLVRAAAYEQGDDTIFVEVTPAEAKRVLNGMPMTASKAQVQRAIRAVVQDCPKVMSEHASDAVAIALAGARMARAPRAPFFAKRKRWRRR